MSEEIMSPEFYVALNAAGAKCSEATTKAFDEYGAALNAAFAAEREPKSQQAKTSSTTLPAASQATAGLC